MLACGACCNRASAGVLVAPCSEFVRGVEVLGPNMVAWSVETPGGWLVGVVFFLVGGGGGGGMGMEVGM